MARWTITDGTETYVFPVNPSAGGSPKYGKRFHRTVPCNPFAGDFTIRMEGRPSAPQGQFSGSTRTQTHYETLLRWALLKPVITITDDLDRTYTVAVVSVNTTPGFKPHAPWRATYRIEYILLNPAVI